MPVWTDPADFSVGEFPTAAKLTAILNNFDCLKCGARVYHSVTQSIADSTVTALAFDAEIYDTDAIHDTVTNNSRLTCKTAGKYLIGGSVTWAANSVGTRELGVRHSSGDFIVVDEKPPLAVTYHTIGATVFPLAVNDYVELTVFQSSTGSLDVSNALYSGAEFFMHFVGG